MSKVWLDVTELHNWNGHLTGIQRVVYNICNELAEDGQTELGFFIYISETDSVHGYDFSSLKDRIMAAQKSEPAAETHATASLSASAKAIQGFKRSTPLWIKQRVPPSAKHFAKKSYHHLKNRRQKMASRQQAKNTAVNLPQISFKNQDKVCVMGRSWDYPGLIDLLQRTKLGVSIEVFNIVYDMIPVWFPQMFDRDLHERYTRHLFEVISLADGLLPISESSAKDVQRFGERLNLKTPPQSVIRLGDELAAGHLQATPPALGLQPDNFVLSVGTIETRKNHTLLYYAWKEGLRRGLDMPRLIIIGGNGWYTGDILHALQTDPALSGLVTVSHSIKDEELNWLYANAMFTIFPSMYEGWGLPVAESLAFGTCCIASGSSSIPEIAGDLIDYFSPYDSGQCLETVIKYLDPAYRRRQKAKIEKSYKPTSWKSTAKQFRSALNY